MNNFRPEEFVMDGVSVYHEMDKYFLLLLEQCRNMAGYPFVITSSFRTLAKNKEVGGSRYSLHTKGRAVDIACTDGVRRARIIKAALAVGLSVGVMKNALHLDDRDVQIVFHYYDQ